MEHRRGRKLGRALSLAELAQDLKYGVRGLLRRPVFAFTCAASLAIGIATTTVAFSLVDTMLLRPLPVKNPSELVVIGGSSGPGLRGPSTPMPAVRELAARTDLFQEVAADRLNMVGLRPPTADQAEVRLIRGVTGNWFSLLGVNAAVGRLLTDGRRAGARARRGARAHLLDPADGRRSLRHRRHDDGQRLSLHDRRCRGQGLPGDAAHDPGRGLRHDHRGGPHPRRPQVSHPGRNSGTPAGTCRWHDSSPVARSNRSAPRCR